jgi:hypothetical protein
MIGLLIDHNIERHGRLIWAQFAEADWLAMHVSSLAFIAQTNLTVDATDREIWNYCQRQGLLLLTANRNQQGEDSLQTVLEQFASASTLPVLTIASTYRVLGDSTYRELCAYRIADIALELPRYLGTARLFIP